MCWKRVTLIAFALVAVPAGLATAGTAAQTTASGTGPTTGQATDCPADRSTTRSCPDGTEPRSNRSMVRRTGPNRFVVAGDAGQSDRPSRVGGTGPGAGRSAAPRFVRPPGTVGDPGTDGELRALGVHLADRSAPPDLAVTVAGTPGNLTTGGGRPFRTPGTLDSTLLYVDVAPAANQSAPAANRIDVDITYGLDVDVDALTALGADPTDVGVVTRRNGSWEPASDASLSRSGSEFVVNVTEPRATTVALGIRHPELAVTNATWPAERLYPDRRVSLELTVRNRGSVAGTSTIPIRTDAGRTLANPTVSVPPGTTRAVAVPIRFGRPGERAVEAGDYETTVEVARPQPNVSVTALDVRSDRVTAGDEASVRATVRNTGPVGGTSVVRLRAFGDVVDARQVSIPAGDSRSLAFSLQLDAPGRQQIRVGNRTTTVTVVGAGDAEQPSTATVVDSPSPRPGPSLDSSLQLGLFALATAAVLLAGFVTARRLTGDT